MPPSIQIRVNAFFLLRTQSGVHSECVISIQLYLLTLVSSCSSDLCKFCLVHSWYLYNWVEGRGGERDTLLIYIYPVHCIPHILSSCKYFYKMLYII
jgi:hypothetical protein